MTKFGRPGLLRPHSTSKADHDHSQRQCLLGDGTDKCVIRHRVGRSLRNVWPKYRSASFLSTRPRIVEHVHQSSGLPMCGPSRLCCCPHRCWDGRADLQSSSRNAHFTANIRCTRFTCQSHATTKRAHTNKANDHSQPLSTRHQGARRRITIPIFKTRPDTFRLHDCHQSDCCFASRHAAVGKDDVPLFDRARYKSCSLTHTNLFPACSYLATTGY